MLYLAADDDAKEALKQAETEGTLSLEGSEDDENRTELVAKIMSILATESPTEKIQREVELVSDIQSCKRKPSESPDVFATRYKTCVARYVNQSTAANRGDDQQWAVMLLRNAMLTPDTLNAITFQLTAGATSANRKSPTVALDAALVKSVAASIAAIEPGSEVLASAVVTESLREQCRAILASAELSLVNTAPTITLEDALAALRKVRVATYIEKRAPITTMLASNVDTQRNGVDPKKRRFDDLKKITPCFGCGRVGHWFKDRRECTQAMNDKTGNRQPRNDKAAEGLRGPVFRAGGQ